MNAHTPFQALVKLDDDGAVTLPASVCARLGWAPGTKLEVIEQAGSIGLWPQATAEASRKAVDEAFSRIQDFNTYRGPMITDEAIDAIVAAAAVDRYRRAS